METYDGIILAAGRNTRLKGLVPSYYKPLVIVNGQPLIVSLVQNMRGLVSTLNIVVSCENAGPMIEILEANGLLDHKINFIIQPHARGPGEGLYRALMACHGSRILMVCGDNQIPADDFSRAIESDVNQHAKLGALAPDLVTVSTVKIAADLMAERFTRIDVGEDKFIENAPGGLWPDGFYRCWIGPLIFDRLEALNRFGSRVLRYKPGDPEIKISPVLNDIPMLIINSVAGHSVDIGTSDGLLESMNG